MYVVAQAEIARPAPGERAQQPEWWKALVALGAVGFSLTLGFMFGEPLGTFASTGATFLPLLFLATLLQVSEWRGARIASWLWFWLIMLGFAAIAIGMTALSFLPVDLEGGQAALTPRLAPAFAAVAAILLVGAVLAGTPLWYWLASRLGGDVDQRSPAHAQGTVGILVMASLAIAPLALLGGRAPLIELLDRIEGSLQGMSFAAQILPQVFQVVWIAVLVLFGCGWPVRLTFRQTIERLGFGPLSRRDLAFLAGVTVATIGVGIALDFVNRVLLSSLGIPMTDPTVVTRLVPAAATPVGGLILAACAGSSEELMFRAWLQPRLGWLLANVGFVAAHAFQYGLDGLVAVFVLGAIMAFVRQRWNTSAAIGVHFAYDAVLFLLAAFGS